MTRKKTNYNQMVWGACCHVDLIMEYNLFVWIWTSLSRNIIRLHDYKFGHPIRSTIASSWFHCSGNVPCGLKINSLPQVDLCHQHRDLSPKVKNGAQAEEDASVVRILINRFDEYRWEFRRIPIPKGHPRKVNNYYYDEIRRHSLENVRTFQN